MLSCLIEHKALEDYSDLYASTKTQKQQYYGGKATEHRMAFTLLAYMYATVFLIQRLQSK